MKLYVISGEARAGKSSLAAKLVGEACVWRLMGPVSTFLERLKVAPIMGVAIAVDCVRTLADLGHIRRAFPDAVHFHVITPNINVPETHTQELADASDYLISWSDA